MWLFNQTIFSKVIKHIATLSLNLLDSSLMVTTVTSTLSTKLYNCEWPQNQYSRSDHQLKCCISLWYHLQQFIDWKKMDVSTIVTKYNIVSLSGHSNLTVTYVVNSSKQLHLNFTRFKWYQIGSTDVPELVYQNMCCAWYSYEIVSKWDTQATLHSKSRTTNSVTFLKPETVSQLKAADSPLI